MKQIIRVILALVVLGIIITVMNGFYVLQEGRQAIITQFGKPVGIPVVDAGIHFKLPFVQKVRYFEKRILIWDGDPNQIPTNDKTFIFLDVTARWRISDALQFYQSVKDISRAMTILDDIIDGTVRDLVNKNNLVEIIRSSDWEPGPNSTGKDSDKVMLGRDKIAEMIHAAASELTPQFGVELVDVMFKRVNYIESVQRKVFERMISERKRIASQKRSLGEGEKAEILGRVQRELSEITSKASREAQEIKGRADAEAAKIFADAYNKDPEFYSFVRTLESYPEIIGDNSRLILSSDSEMYRYLKGVK